MPKPIEGNFNDEGLSFLAQLPNLECLSVKSDYVTGIGFASLSKLPGLHCLRLRGPMRGSTLDGLKSWPVLEVLNLGGRGMTDEILLTLPEMQNIKSLSLHGAGISDRGLMSLRQLPNLEELNLLLTHATDQGLDFVVACKRLQKLCLGEAGPSQSITEKGLSKLSQLRQLESLDLRYVNLINVDLGVLAFPSLKNINVEGLSSQQREGKLSHLRKLLPKLGPIADKRLPIIADLLAEPVISSYDIFENRMKVNF